MTTTFLLDVNVLIALVDPTHVQHDAAHDWFAQQGRKAWATCPLTENGLVRVVGHARYPNSPGTPAAVLPLLATLRSLPGHAFWPDDISLLDTQVADSARIHGPRQITDLYLLALAVRHRGQFVTFDASVSLDAIKGAEKKHILIL